MFEATTRLLEQLEPAQISTNAIAKLAGVSIGTLYQYFPDKESLFQALLARELGGLSARVLEVMQTPPARPGGRIGAVLGAVLDAYGGRKLAHQRLMRYSLERGTSGLLQPLLEQLMTSFSTDGVTGAGMVMPPLSRTDAFVLTHAVAGVTRAAITAHASGELDREALEQSLTRLVLGFAMSAKKQ
ncbi:TetR/AcrR family transcriptional regulator [Roseateles sp. NT4]|uniref:TetR/AcrR family transcriptional regulator n=1 Tax=Roseateles sp. NT4 TaxID=3453715 RepID=UPI003EEABDE8